MNIINHKKIPKITDFYTDYDNFEWSEEDDDFDIDEEEELKPGHKRKKARRKVKQTETLETERRYLIITSDGTYKESNKPGGMKWWTMGGSESVAHAKKRLGL